MDVAMVFSALNVAVLVILLYVYGRIAARSRAVLSVGLVVFSVFLLTQNLLSLYAFYAMEPLFGAETMPFLSAASVLQFAAYALLLGFTI